jgi:hypothetical protein
MLESATSETNMYIASAIGDGQRRLQMIANKNGGHIEPYLETHN